MTTHTAKKSPFSWIETLHKKKPTLAKKLSLTANISAITAHSLWAGIPLFPAGAIKVFGAKFGKMTGVASRADKAIVEIADSWIERNNWLIERMLPTKNWHITLPDDLDKTKNYLLICNHQSWVDTSIIQYISSGRLALTRFFIKKELIFIPVVGQAFYLLDFPMMKRHSKEAVAKNPALKYQDLAEIRRACSLLENKPFVLLNYLEGTRFTPKKHSKQHSPFTHLLKPKAGGFALALASLGDRIDGILDMTVVYPDGIPEYGELWAGELENLIVDIRHAKMPDELFDNLKQGAYHDDTASTHTTTKQGLHDWLDALWAEKDKRIDEMLRNFNALNNKN